MFEAAGKINRETTKGDPHGVRQHATQRGKVGVQLFFLLADSGRMGVSLNVGLTRSQNPGRDTITSSLFFQISMQCVLLPSAACISSV